MSAARVVAGAAWLAILSAAAAGSAQTFREAGPRSASPDRGAAVYQRWCAPCHQPDGAGVARTTPPLALSDYLVADRERSVGVVLNGMTGPVVVNESHYDGVMPSFRHLSDDEIASLLTYVMSAWGNPGGAVDAEEVSRLRGATRPETSACKSRRCGGACVAGDGQGGCGCGCRRKP